MSFIWNLMAGNRKNNKTANIKCAFYTQINGNMQNLWTVILLEQHIDVKGEVLPPSRPVAVHDFFLLLSMCRFLHVAVKVCIKL